MSALDRTKIRKVLVISLTNIGDVILTFPVMDILRRDFPEASLSVVVGPKGAALFKGNRSVARVHVFDKHKMGKEVFAWIGELRRERFDLIVDLRNTAIPFLAGCRYRTSPFFRRQDGEHMRRQHLRRLATVHAFGPEPAAARCLEYDEEDRMHVDALWREDIADGQKIIVVAPGAADERKRWPQERFAALCDLAIVQYGVSVVFVGDAPDRATVAAVRQAMRQPAVDWSGRLSLTQLGYLFTRSLMAVVNDSGPMHLASYVNVPTLAIFGPTDPARYGPWGAQSRVLRKADRCPACRKTDDSAHTCLEAVTCEDAMKAFSIRPEGVIFTS